MERQCQADFLFDKKFLVWVPFYSIVDERLLEYYGIAGHHSKEELDKIMSAITPAKIPLSKMAELVNNGVGVVIDMTPEEVAQAYNAITTHIENWLYIGNRHGWWKLPPLEDMLAFDGLAKYLYDLIEFVDEPTGLGLDMFSGLMETRTPEKPVKPPYQTYSDILIDRCTRDTFNR